MMDLDLALERANADMAAARQAVEDAQDLPAAKAALARMDEIGDRLLELVKMAEENALEAVRAAIRAMQEDI